MSQSYYEQLQHQLDEERNEVLDNKIESDQAYGWRLQNAALKSGQGDGNTKMREGDEKNKRKRTKKRKKKKKQEESAKNLKFLYHHPDGNSNKHLKDKNGGKTTSGRDNETDKEKILAALKRNLKVTKTGTEKGGKNGDHQQNEQQTGGEYNTSHKGVQRVKLLGQSKMWEMRDGKVLTPTMGFVTKLKSPFLPTKREMFEAYTLPQHQSSVKALFQRSEEGGQNVRKFFERPLSSSLSVNNNNNNYYAQAIPTTPSVVYQPSHKKLNVEIPCATDSSVVAAAFYMPEQSNISTPRPWNHELPSMPYNLEQRTLIDATTYKDNIKIDNVAGYDVLRRVQSAKVKRVKSESNVQLFPVRLNTIGYHNQQQLQEAGKEKPKNEQLTPRAQLSNSYFYLNNTQRSGSPRLTATNVSHVRPATAMSYNNYTSNRQMISPNSQKRNHKLIGNFADIITSCVFRENGGAPAQNTFVFYQSYTPKNQKNFQTKQNIQDPIDCLANSKLAIFARPHSSTPHKTVRTQSAFRIPKKSNQIFTQDNEF